MWHNLTFCDGVVLGHPAGQHRVLAQPVNLGQGADSLGVVTIKTMKPKKTKKIITAMIISWVYYNKQDMDFLEETQEKLNPAFESSKRVQSQKRKSVFTKTLIRKWDEKLAGQRKWCYFEFSSALLQSNLASGNHYDLKIIILSKHLIKIPPFQSAVWIQSYHQIINHHNQNHDHHHHIITSHCHLFNLVSKDLTTIMLTKPPACNYARNTFRPAVVIFIIIMLMAVIVMMMRWLFEIFEEHVFDGPHIIILDNSWYI